MPEIPAPQIKSANIINRILEISIKEVGVKLAKTAIVAEVPFLGWPGFSQLLDYFLGRIAGYFYLSTAQFATFQIIDAQTTAQKEAYEATITQLKNAIDSGVPSDVEKAREEFKKKLEEFIRWDGEARIK